MARDVLHVVPQGDTWGVKKEGNERFSSTHNTQKEAIDSARDLAEDGDDILIHRTDGTIRNRMSFTGTQANDRPSPENRTQIASPHDVISVGERVSWQAVLAGVAVAFTLYLLLSLLAVAIGISTVDSVQYRTFAIGAAIVGIFILLVALFMGGFVASRLTTRETLAESVIYGVLLWAGLFLVFLVTGLNIGSNLALMPDVTRPATAEARPSNRPAQDTSTAEAQRRRDEVMARGERLVSDMNPSSLAWWAFAAMTLSLLAAIAGSLTGAGPHLVFRRRIVQHTGNGRVAVESRPVVT
jgi:hypothetical protein